MATNILVKAAPGVEVQPDVVRGLPLLAPLLRPDGTRRGDDGGDVAAHPCVVQAAVELVDREWPEGIADVGAVEGDAYPRQVCALGPAVQCRAARDPAVVGEVVEVESLYLTPA